MQEKSSLRHVIIGIGARIIKHHRRGVALESAELVAGSDRNAELGRQRAEELGCPFYQDHRAMLSETKPDVAVILTPPPSHAAIAIDCLEAGCHVLVEKPMAVEVTEADAMIKAAAKAARFLAVNFQHRFRPEVQAARRLIREGELGEIQRVEALLISPRTPVYYQSDGWRETWGGAGGGVLLNQAPHDLDLICYLAGRPARVVGWTRTLVHTIETEDTAHAMMEWPNGALGFLHASTAEIGPAQSLDIFGTRGSLHIGPGELSFQQIDGDIRDLVLRSSQRSPRPELRSVPVELGGGAGDHVAVYRNFHDAILHETDLVISGTEGRMSLELSNAIIYSSYTHSEVELPLDRRSYADLLERLKTAQVT